MIQLFFFYTDCVMNKGYAANETGGTVQNWTIGPPVPFVKKSGNLAWDGNQWTGLEIGSYLVGISIAATLDHQWHMQVNGLNLSNAYGFSGDAEKLIAWNCIIEITSDGSTISVAATAGSRVLHKEMTASAYATFTIIQLC